MDGTITVYDVKYTLASGKGKIRARRAKQIGDKLVTLTSLYHDMRKIGQDCAIDPNVALELAAELRDRKIHNLKKQIARLEAMQFEIVNEFNA